jgi:hypothetical protein
MGRSGSGREGGRGAAAEGGAGAPDYRETFEVSRGAADRRSPEQWMRAVFEDAPLPLRWSLLVGWRVGLGLRLGPRSSPEHVLGWPVASSGAGAIRLEAHSPLMTAGLVLRLDASTAALTSTVSYHRRAARPLWTAVLPVHRRMAPYLLRRAAVCKVRR